jgi:hypothetical protein
MKTLTVRQHSFQNLTQFSMLNKVQEPLACNINASLTRAAVLLPLLESGDSAQRWYCWPRKTLRARQYPFKDQTEFTILTMLLDPLLSNMKDSLTNLQFLCHLLVWADFVKSWYSSKMKMLTVGQRSFQKLTQFTMFTKVQDTLACKINPSLTRATVLLPFTWMGWFSTKVMLLIQENSEK